MKIIPGHNVERTAVLVRHSWNIFRNCTNDRHYTKLKFRELAGLHFVLLIIRT